MSKENDFLLFYTPPHGYPDLLHEIGAFDMKHTVLAYVVSFWVLGLRFQDELAKTQGIPNCFCPKTQFRVRHIDICHGRP